MVAIDWFCLFLLDRRVRVSHSFGRETSNRSIYASVGASITDWLWEGFNGSIIAIGQSQAGKTHTLLGTPGDPLQRGMFGDLLADLFDRITRSHRGAYVVGLSAWEVCEGHFALALSSFIWCLLSDPW